jgi:ribonuclease HI
MPPLPPSARRVLDALAAAGRCPAVAWVVERPDGSTAVLPAGRESAVDVELYFDGACEPNPGMASFGWVAKDAATGRTLGSGDGVVGGPSATCNVAEYYALGHGLKWLTETPPDGLGSVTVYGDSKLVVEQMTGRWQCNAEHLQRLRDRCIARLGTLQSRGVAVRLEWVPRERNAEADALSVRAWEGKTGRKFPVRRRP